jgi:hypothetical protein
MTDLGPVLVPLHEIAHGRTGDKGNRANASVIAYIAEVFPILLEQVSVERVRQLVGHRGAGAIVRYELPNLGALNFVIDEVLEGGVNGSLNLDGHGKTMSFHLLSMTIAVPPSLLAACRKARLTG